MVYPFYHLFPFNTKHGVSQTGDMMMFMSTSFYVCASCRKQVKDVFAVHNGEGAPITQIQPDGGVEFIGYGAYGSNYDSSKKLHVVICDECVKDLLNTANGVFQENPPVVTVPRTLTPTSNANPYSD